MLAHRAALLLLKPIAVGIASWNITLHSFVGVCDKSPFLRRSRHENVRFASALGSRSYTNARRGRFHFVIVTAQAALP